VLQIAADELTKVADANWSSAAQSAKAAPKFLPELVDAIYKKELGGGGSHPPKLKRVMLLEISQYLENYLWPHFDAQTASDAHVLSILVSFAGHCCQGCLCRFDRHGWCLAHW
jgi:intron-binding protein aquarius